MHIKDIESLFSENRKVFKETIYKIDNDVFDKKQSENKWSASEQFHHIYLTKKRITEVIQNLNKEMKRAKEVLITEIPVREVFEKITYDKMPEIPLPGTEPSNAFSKEQLVGLMENACMEMDGYFRNCKKYDCSSIKAEHPFIGSMNCYEWFYIDAMHEKSHLEHIISEYLSPERSAIK